MFIESLLSGKTTVFFRFYTILSFNSLHPLTNGPIYTKDL